MTTSTLPRVHTHTIPELNSRVFTCSTCTVLAFRTTSRTRRGDHAPPWKSPVIDGIHEDLLGIGTQSDVYVLDATHGRLVNHDLKDQYCRQRPLGPLQILTEGPKPVPGALPIGNWPAQPFSCYSNADLMTDLNNILMHVPAGNEFADINGSSKLVGDLLAAGSSRGRAA
jgi:hypothetical protein